MRGEEDGFARTRPAGRVGHFDLRVLRASGASAGLAAP
jgi:hypothetical protein